MSGLSSNTPFVLSTPITHIISGASVGIVSSGAFLSQPSFMLGWQYCGKCNKYLGGDIFRDSVCVGGASGLQVFFCWGCAGFDHNTLSFPDRRWEWIKESLPLWFDADTTGPSAGIADWLEEQSRYKDAEYVRGLLK